MDLDLKKLRDKVSKEIAKNMKFNELNTKVKNLERKIPDVTTLIHISQCNTNSKLEMLIKKIFDLSGLVTTALLNTKIGKGEYQRPDTSGLVNVLNTKIEEFTLPYPSLIVLFLIHHTHIENNIPDISGLVTKTSKRC